MKTMQLNKNSWHYKLLSKLDMEHRRFDFCSYFRAVMVAGTDQTVYVTSEEISKFKD